MRNHKWFKARINNTEIDDKMGLVTLKITEEEKKLWEKEEEKEERGREKIFRIKGSNIKVK